MMSMTQPIFGRIAFDDPFFQPWHKASVGLDAVLDRLQYTMDRHDEVQRVANTSFPPVNILRNGLKYRIELAVAGFKISDIKINVEGDTLLVLGEQTETALPEGVEYTHRGIAARSFTRKFFLDEYVEVTGANMVDGMLYIDLAKNVPEEKQPRTIVVGSSAPESFTKSADQV